MYQAALDRAVEKTLKNLKIYVEQFPHVGEEKGGFALYGNTTWTNGFWTGVLWLLFEYSGDSRFAEVAEGLLPSFRERLDQNVNIDHDIGFLYTLSAQAQWMIRKDESARELAIEAARKLADRWNEEGQYIQAWGDKGDTTHSGRIIIDCLLNLPILYWTAGETGDDRLLTIARKQAEKSRKFLVRGDDSSYHTFVFDPANGQPVGGATHQGLHHGSTWSRGQSWGVYGFPLSYRYTKNKAFLETGIRMAKYFIEQLPADLISHWDFEAERNDDTPRDSSATAIALCGILEILEHLEKDSSDFVYFSKAAGEIMDALIRETSTMDEPDLQGLIKHGAYHVSNNYVPDGFLIFGDYYYLEALMRMTNKSKGYW
ncbi:glycoside hydrolase family 88 protein [Paenibacillus nasutitermitis]|uniref:Unsaturated chondroitin disaccharide hydrolase n=1 Tax=Paenibacillus nasutitermitis TaxID=1652958 RepID=A0A917E049_9BACL|nr:glycoside hydrolase family 88 protein [Paenibacillus nasutitermitis]GGD83459.1 unsaturated chondroitin disaccharide hydrolase [Paenibacillus nasutitermitis]